VRSPSDREGEAFRFVLLVVVALGLVVLAAALGSTWLALAVLAVVLAALAMRAIQLSGRRHRALPLKSAPAHAGPANQRRVLVVANDTLGEEAVLGEVERLLLAQGTRVILLAPALISPAARLTGATDAPLEEARARVVEALVRFGRELDVEGEISDSEPVEAVEDAVATFAVDEIVVCTRGERAPRALEPRLAQLVRDRFAVPVRHLVVEPASEGREPGKGAADAVLR
jgi:hypothetical protein